jgi:N-acetylglutamate synthase
MTDFTLVQQLETRLINAWPSFETQIAGGWILRFAKGYSKRANSASPLVPGATLDDAQIDQILTQFAAQRLRPIFRLTTLQAPDVDARLAARGFIETEASYGMIVQLSEAPGLEPQVEIEPTVIIAPTATARWTKEVAASYGGDKANHFVLAEIIARIRQPAAYATLSLDGRPSAWGLAVAERGFVGLFDIVVAPDLRGLGLGRQVVCALMAWARKHGAERAYLQVRETNTGARDLYRTLGFTDAYRYTHRVAP